VKAVGGRTTVLMSFPVRATTGGIGLMVAAPIPDLALSDFMTRKRSGFPNYF